MLHPEQKQALKDFAFVQAERDFLNMQDLMEEMDRERKPAKIEIKFEKTEVEEESV